jgi:hypothetical protein
MVYNKGKMTTTEKSILHTLAYSHIFHFPLTKEEIWRFLISDKKITKDDFDNSLKSLSAKMSIKDGFYSLRGDKKAFQQRINNLPVVQRKMRIAKRAAFYLSYIPTISLIGLSGGLAMENADAADDIDFFIITKKNTLFMTRLWVQAILEQLHLRRKRGERDAQDKICVNLLIDESRLIWPGESRDIYTAHEIVQMKPLFERKNMYETFCSKNRWVESFLPNAFDTTVQTIGANWKREYVSLGALSSVMMLRPLESLVGVLQRRYMKQHQTSEIISRQVLAFHPIDYRMKTLDELSIQLTQLGLLTNK